MIAVYSFAAIFGGLLVAIFALGVGDFDSDIEIDTDAGFDSPDVSGALQVFSSVLSVRNIVFFAAFFGVGGLLLTFVGAGSALTVILAVGTGLGAAVMNHTLFGYVKRTSSDSMVGNARIAGNVAKVILPIATERKGRVSVTVDGHQIYLVALPYNDTDDIFDIGDRVVIVTVDNGSALVTAAEF